MNDNDIITAMKIDGVWHTTNNDCIFEIPKQLCRILGIEEFGDPIKRYMVKEDGTLWLPWGLLLEGAAWDGIFREAESLIRSSDYQYRKMYREKIELLVSYHENRFDPSIGRVEA
jgi:hypothetical protein